MARPTTGPHFIAAPYRTEKAVIRYEEGQYGAAYATAAECQPLESTARYSGAYLDNSQSDRNGDRCGKVGFREVEFQCLSAEQTRKCGAVADELLDGTVKGLWRV